MRGELPVRKHYRSVLGGQKRFWTCLHCEETMAKGSPGQHKSLNHPAMIKKRVQLSPEERAQANRERDREYSRQRRAVQKVGKAADRQAGIRSHLPSLLDEMGVAHVSLSLLLWG